MNITKLILINKNRYGVMVENNKIDIMIEPTNRCTFRCPTCFSHQDGRKKNDMSLGEFKKIVDRNSDLIGNISLYNYGEPLLNRNISKMISYGKRKGIRFIKVSTNGMFLNKDIIKNLLISRLDYLSISVDGATENVYNKFRKGGDFKKIISNIKNLVVARNLIDSNLKIEIQFIIMKHNQHQIQIFSRLARKLGVDFLRFKKLLVKRKKWSYLLPTLRQYNRYKYAKKFNSCFKPLKELVINCDGNIIPCCYIVEEDVKKFKFGNIFEQTLRETINSDSYKEFTFMCTMQKSDLSCCRECNEGNISLNYKVTKFEK